MVTVLTPSGVELPDGSEQHSRALYNRNLTRQNDAEKARLASTGIPFGHAGCIAGFQSIAGTDKPVTIKDQLLRGGMTFETASGGRLVIPKSGLYDVRVKVYATNGSGYDFMGAAYVNSDKIEGTEVFDYKQTSSDYKQHGICTFAFVAGDKIGLGMTSPQSTWGTDGWNGAFLEVKWFGE